MNNAYFFLILFIFPFLGFNQNIGVGGAAIYNLQSESLGVAGRLSIYPKKTVSFVPQFSYYFSGPISEWTAGLSIEVKAVRLKTLDFYLLGHGGYNNWLNPEESALKSASATNWNAEIGIGITTNKCIRPFLEYRYNIKFQETHIQFGVFYLFGCKNKGGSYRYKKKMKKVASCPAYN
jgi:hypothetical protein